MFERAAVFWMTVVFWLMVFRLMAVLLLVTCSK